MPSTPVTPPSRFTAALQKLAGPAGVLWNRASALVLAVWITHGLLRGAVLFRPDGFGYPLVGKADWYIFHALFLDLHWIALSALPLFVLLRFAAVHNRPRLGRVLLTAFFVFHAVFLWLTVADHETLRFMGMHLDPGMMRTYGNSAALYETFAFLAHDASIPGLPYVLFLGCVPLTAWLYRWFKTRAFARHIAWNPKPVLWLLALSLVGYIYVYHAWTGGNRMRKLRPFIQTAYISLYQSELPHLGETDFAALTARYRALWLKGSTDTNWVFPNPRYPYYKEPRRASPTPSSQSSQPPQNPADAGDLRPWNFVFIILESHRALNVGHLAPFGATSSATPFLDSLAGAGHYWTRMVASGIPTINALMAMHLSIPQHPTRQLASEFTTLRHEAFTVPFARRGYLTRFFSAADPAWDNQTPWLRQWYGGIRYDRARENDAALFADLGQWMRDSLSGSRSQPFFLTAMTKTNHYPFNPVPGVRPVADDAPLVERMDATMAYTDSSMRAFFSVARTQPWFNRTVFVIVADHGFPLSEHGSSQIGYGLYNENIWLPFVMVGPHPALGAPRARHDLAAQVDIAPTVLALAGIREANAYVGHNLLAPRPIEQQTRYVLFHEQAIVERGRYRWHGPWSTTPREQGEELFDVVTDRAGHHNLLVNQSSPPESKTPAAVLGGGVSDPRVTRAWVDSLSHLARDLGRLHVEVLESDLLWPPADSSGTVP